MPNSPKELSPQQYSELLVVTAQASSSPANTDANVTPAGAAIGAGLTRLDSDPLPSSPLGFFPQQYTVPPVPRAQVNHLPTLTSTKVAVPTVNTRLGPESDRTVPKNPPSAPAAFVPQQ